MAKPDELSFMYFPEDYRWSHGVLIGLNSAPWGAPRSTKSTASACV